jgi:hypothetical protein
MTLRLPDVAYDLDLSGLVRKQWKEMVLKGRIYPLSPVGKVLGIGIFELNPARFQKAY